MRFKQNYRQMISLNASDRLRAALEHKSDLELRFESGQNVPVHSVRLSLNSSVIRSLLDDVMEDQMESAKRKRVDEDSSYCTRSPHIKVLLHAKYIW